MSRVFYPVRYRLDNTERFLLWHSASDDGDDEADGVVTQANKVPVFRSLQSLLAYAQSTGLSPVDEGNPAFFDLDAVKRWLRRKRPARLDCVVFLNAWNLLADLSASVKGDFDPDKDETGRVYLKLFWGSNIPAITPPGKHYDPVWPGRESRMIRRVLSGGLSLFRSLASSQPEQAAA